MLSSTSRARAAVPGTFLVAAALLVGCKEPVPEDCVSTEDFFFDEVYSPILSSTCYACHNAQGEANDSEFVMQPPTQTGFEDFNYSLFERLSNTEIDGESIVLLKPTNRTSHDGGVQIVPGSAEEDAIREMVRQFDNPVVCEETGDNDGIGNVVTGVINLDDLATIRRATLTLVGRLPTPEEEDNVLTNGESGIRSVLEGVMEEDEFYDWLMESYNDLFLTDRYLPGNDAVNLLNGDDFPNRYWHDNIDQDSDPEFYELAQRYTNDSVAQEPLQLVAYVVRNHRPFTEILTADYRLVNPFSARVYGMEINFDDPRNPDEWREGRLDGVPMAGVLTSPMWLNRFPTTDTNRNRHRSRMVYSFFLATDVMRLAERPVDPTSISDFNPTMFNPNCTVCHANIDPIAGAFQNWSASGRYLPPDEGWYTDMRPPGFSEEQQDWIPHDQRFESLPWLADRITDDDRFALATVHTMYRALTGQTALAAPTDSADADYARARAEYTLQRDEFERVAQIFIGRNYDIRAIITELVIGRYFRADNYEGDGDPEQLQAMGVARLLTPEALNRRITAVLGYPWRRDANASDYLLSGNEYRIFYGGIDSNSVVNRITDPNGVMANIQFRMANEMSCRAVPQDFHLAQQDRILFPYVNAGFAPEDDNGFEIPQSVEAIRANIQYLHHHILGEELGIMDAEIDRTYQIFYDTWQEGLAGLALPEDGGGYSSDLNWNCRAVNDFWTGEDYPEDDRVTRDEDYTIRAWMAVVSYLLADYRFVYE